CKGRAGDRLRRRERRTQSARRPGEAELSQKAKRCARIERERREEKRLDGAPTRRERPDQPTVGARVVAELPGCLVDAAHDESGVLVVERMRDARRRLEPLDVEVERGEARRRTSERMDRRADVVCEAGER